MEYIFDTIGQTADETASLTSTLYQNDLEEHISRALSGVCSPERNWSSFLTKLCFPRQMRKTFPWVWRVKKGKYFEVITGYSKVHPVILKFSDSGHE